MAVDMIGNYTVRKTRMSLYCGAKDNTTSVRL